MREAKAVRQETLVLAALTATAAAFTLKAPRHGALTRLTMRRLGTNAGDVDVAVRAGEDDVLRVVAPLPLQGSSDVWGGPARGFACDGTLAVSASDTADAGDDVVLVAAFEVATDGVAP